MQKKVLHRCDPVEMPEEPQISPISPMAAVGGSCRAGSFPATREKICVIGAICGYPK
jgi:hypothetical protein